MAKRFNPSEEYAVVNPPYRGATLKQPPTSGGTYFDAAGNVVDVSGVGAQDAQQQTFRPPLIDPRSIEDRLPVLSEEGYLTWGRHRWVRSDRHDQIVSDLKRKIDSLDKAPPEKADLRQVDVEQFINKVPPASTVPPAPAEPDGTPPNPAVPPAVQEPEIPPLAALLDVISADDINRLGRFGIRDVRDLAALDADSLAGLREQGVSIKPAVIQAATKLLAEKIPGAVVSVTPPEKAPTSGITKAELIAWAKKEGPKHHWQTIRKAMLEHFAVNANNETYAVSIMIRDGALTADEAKR